MKTCSKCGQVLPKTAEFFAARSDFRDGLMGRCRQCQSESNRAYHESHRDEIEKHRKTCIEALTPEERQNRLDYWKGYYREHRDHTLEGLHRNYEKNKDAINAKRRHGRWPYWLRRYGLTPALYLDIVVAQAGLCPICGAQLTGRVHVDHCHETGRVRGVLCHQCNCGIGFLRDDSTIVAQALAYLKESEDAYL